MTDFISSISNATNQVIQTKQRGEALQEQQRNNLDQQSARISAQGSQMLSDIDNLSNFLKGEAAWDSQVRAARTGMVQFSKDFSHAADLDEYNGPAARLIASQQIKTLYNPALPNISPQERANRGLILQEDPRLRVVMASIDREVKQLPAVQIGDRRVALSEYQTLLTSPGLDGDRARRHLENADESLQMQLLASPELNGKLSAVRHPGTGKIQLVTPDELVEYRKIAGAKINMAAEFTQNFGRAPAEAPKEFARFTQQKQTELSERMDLTELSRDARERRVDLFRGKYKTMPAQTSLGETREVPIGPAPMDAYAQVEEANVVAVLDPIKDFTREQKLAIDAEVLGLGEASVAFHRTYTRLTKGGMKETDAAMAALTEAREAADLFKDWERLRANDPKAVSMSLKELFHSGATVDQLRSRAQLLTSVASDPMEAYQMSRVIRAEHAAYRDQAVTPEEEQTRIGKIQWASRVSKLIPPLPIDRLVGPQVDIGELQESADLLKGYSGEYISPKLLSLIERINPDVSDLRNAAAYIAVLDAAEDLGDMSAILTNAEGAAEMGISQRLRATVGASQVFLSDKGAVNRARGAISAAASQATMVEKVDQYVGENVEGNKTERAPAPRASSDGLNIPSASDPAQSKFEQVPVQSTASRTVSKITQTFAPKATIEGAFVDEAWQGLQGMFATLRASSSDDATISAAMDMLFSEELRGARNPTERAQRIVVVQQLREKLAVQQRAFQAVRLLESEANRILELPAEKDGSVTYRISDSSPLLSQKTTAGENFRGAISAGTLDPRTRMWTVKVDNFEALQKFIGGVHTEARGVAGSLQSEGPFSLSNVAPRGAASRQVTLATAQRFLERPSARFKIFEKSVDMNSQTGGLPSGGGTYKKSLGKGLGAVPVDGVVAPPEGDPDASVMHWFKGFRPATRDARQHKAELAEITRTEDEQAMAQKYLPAWEAISELKRQVDEAVAASPSKTRDGAAQKEIFFDIEKLQTPEAVDLLVEFGGPNPFQGLNFRGGKREGLVASPEAVQRFSEDLQGILINTVTNMAELPEVSERARVAAIETQQKERSQSDVEILSKLNALEAQGWAKSTSSDRRLIEDLREKALATGRIEALPDGGWALKE
jgi:hypothetical protein